MYTILDPLGVFFIVLARIAQSRYARIVQSRYARIAPTINANHSGEELYHFPTKIDCAQSSCIWEQVRARAHTSLGLVRIYTHTVAHFTLLIMSQFALLTVPQFALLTMAPQSTQKGQVGNYVTFYPKSSTEHPRASGRLLGY